MTVASSCSLHLTGDSLQLPVGTSSPIATTELIFKEALEYSTVGGATDRHVDCRDVTQEVQTPVGWVKDLQIEFTDAGDQQTQVGT